jgi:uncharacterized protein (TIGR02118 family)
MALIVAVYNKPKDAAAFNAYYFAKRVPIAKAIPGLRSYQVSDGAVVAQLSTDTDAGPVRAPAEPGAIHLVALLEFDSVDAITRALGSPEGQATAADLGNFADGGVDLYLFNTKPV